jgi:HTH-type transcriptional regulator / antitoxin HigA
MTLTFNPQRYSSLLAETLPQVIQTEAEYDRLLGLAEQLHSKKQTRTPEESALQRLLVMLIEAYEETKYPMPSSPPHRILQHILEMSGTHSDELVGWLGSDRVVADILSGERAIDRTQADLLSDRFKVSATLFHSEV